MRGCEVGVFNNRARKSEEAFKIFVLQIIAGGDDTVIIILRDNYFIIVFYFAGKKRVKLLVGKLGDSVRRFNG
jgi:hypothetical protein